MQSNVEHTREEADGGEDEEAVKRPGIKACAVSCGSPGQPIVMKSSYPALRKKWDMRDSYPAMWKK